jgi:hypothetical protein
VSVLYCTISRKVPELTLVSCGLRKLLFQGIRRPGHEADRYPPSSDEFNSSGAALRRDRLAVMPQFVWHMRSSDEKPVGAVLQKPWTRTGEERRAYR